MDVGTALVANGQAAILGQPSKRALHHPAVPSQSVLSLDAFPGDPALDPASTQERPAARDVIALIRMELLWPLPPATPRRLDRGNGGDEALEEHRVVPVGAAQEGDEGDALSVDHNMPLRARFAFICWIRPGFTAPFFAGTLAESSEARVQSIWSASPNRSSSARCNRSQTPASCQSRNRRQRVTPLPHPISWGNISHGMPDFNTKMIPVRAARSEIGGRPPFGFGCLTGSSGSITAHSSSLTNGFRITGQHTGPPTRF